jgi:hypothetical protein
MPSNAREIAENFIVSAVQALTACGEITASRINEDSRRIIMDQRDGCTLEVPFEAVRYMSATQFRTIFGGTSSTTNEYARGLLSLGPAATGPALPAELPAITVHDANIRRALSTETRQAAVRNMVDNTYALSMRATDRVSRNSRSLKISRGNQFIAGLSILGIKLPGLFALPVGDVLHAMYSNIEDQVFSYKERLETLQREFESRQAQNTEAVEKYKADAETAKKDADRLATLRDAAVAWRTNEGSVDEKFERFQSMMSAIDSLSDTAPGVPEVPDLTPLSTPEEAATFASAVEALATAAPQNADAEPTSRYATVEF